MKDWKPPTKDFVPIGKLTANKDLRTVEEIKTNPYPDNIQLLCYNGDTLHDNDEDDKDGDIAKEEETINARLSGRWAGTNDDLNDSENLLPCEIIKSTSIGTFTVRIFHGKHSTLVKFYPMRSVVVMMNKYSSDQHLEGAFRHSIGISDDIFPERWKNSEL